MKRASLILAALVLLLDGVGQARADYIATVTWDTSTLTNNPSQGPFALDIGLTSSRDINNNTAKISNFNLHGGSLTSGTITTSGSVTGNLGSTLTLTSNPSGDYQQQFTPGSPVPSSLSFTLDLTTKNVGLPDFFEISLVYLITPHSSVTNGGLLNIAITGPNPSVSAQGSSLENGASYPAPVVTEVSSAAPEPASLTLLGIGAVCSLGYGWRRRRQSA